MSKIIVKPEGREHAYWVEDRKSLIDFIEGLKISMFHSFKGSPPMLIGCDWDIKNIIDLIKEADEENGIAIITKEISCKNLGHSLIVYNNHERTVFDIGEIKKEDLEIIS